MRRTLLMLLALTAVFAAYARHFPRCFDVLLLDESSYMHRGQLGPIVFANWETSPLYLLYYRLLSWPVRDPVRLYLDGSLLILFLAFIAAAAAILVLSRSPVLTVLLSGLALTSSAFAVEPRVSFAATVVLALGIPPALRLPRLADRLAVITVVAFVVTFLRPEYVVSFYLASLATVVATLRKREHPRVPMVCLAVVIALSLAWCFPVVRGGGRGFNAFGQHFALRWVEAHGSRSDPWLEWKRIVDGEFPGVSTVGGALGSAPSKVLGFYLSNLVDLVSSFARSLGRALLTPFLLVPALALVLWRRHVQPRRPDPELLWDLAAISLFTLPPILASLLVYPREHYLVLLELAAAMMLARYWRSRAAEVSPPLWLLMALAAALTIPPLPAVEQKNSAVIEALRKLPTPARMLEIDGGWCWYLSPPCTPVFLNKAPPEEIRSVLEDGGGVLVSPRMRAFLQLHPLELPRWPAYALAPGYELLLR